MDTEGHYKGHGLCVLQVATPDKVARNLCYFFNQSKRAYVFDLTSQEVRQQLFSVGLREILESTTVVKIFHDCRDDR